MFPYIFFITIVYLKFYLLSFIMIARPVKDKYFMNIAREVAQRSTCLRRKFGAIIVKDNVILSSGYFGAPRGTPNCIDLGKCALDEVNVPITSKYEACRGVHAEMNTVINAARSGARIINGTMYVYGYDTKAEQIIYGKPCKVCRRVIVNAGIRDVVLLDRRRGVKRYIVRYWVREARKDPMKELREQE